MKNQQFFLRADIKLQHEIKGCFSPEEDEKKFLIIGVLA
ncbi:hypothetical protein F3D3_3514 [Fusibacter sp. 3D3]|nr:hypothetical protein F3D3_3514 [Fusibacter sp. 3D3]